MKKAKFFIRLFIFALLTAGILLFVSNFLCVANEKDAMGVYGFLKEPEDSLDVVLIGASALYSSFYSPLAYEQQGFTSYSLSTSSMTCALYRYAAELAIETQHPQLLIFETRGICYEDQLDEVSLCKFIDALPASELKNRAIADLIPQNLHLGINIPFERYHSSYDRLGDLANVYSDKMQINSIGYSYTKNFGTTPFRQQLIRKSMDYDVSDDGLKYLQILLDYLKEADIENVLFIRNPAMVEYGNTDSYKQMIEMIREAGFDYVNLCAAVDDIGVDITHDYYNTTHFNMYGAEKFTAFFADYIMKRYKLNTQHDEKVTEEWEDCASYNNQIISYVKDLTDQDANGFLYTQKDYLGG